MEIGGGHIAGAPAGARKLKWPVGVQNTSLWTAVIPSVRAVLQVSQARRRHEILIVRRSLTALMPSPPRPPTAAS